MLNGSNTAEESAHSLRDRGLAAHRFRIAETKQNIVSQESREIICILFIDALKQLIYPALSFHSHITFLSAIEKNLIPLINARAWH
jgi:hypothetical protein